MNQRTRYSEHANTETATPASELQRVRSETDALLEAADEAINRVLSNDSQQFLEQSRQHGGQ
jgi:hypothetical protein